MSIGGRAPSPRPELSSLEPYSPGPLEDIRVRLHANESRWAVPPSVRKAVMKAAGQAALYPDTSSSALRKALSTQLGVPSDCIVTGAGADMLVDMLARAFGGPGRAVVDCPPTFGMYRFYSMLAGSTVVDAPRREDFSMDPRAVVSAVGEAGAAMVFLCSPNNPDGGLIPRNVLDCILGLPALVVLDEAYVEFSSARSLAAEAASSENLVVLRTFSKWAGLAGLRVGYAVASRAVCEALCRVRPPYPVSSLSEAAAVASVGESALFEKLAARTAAARERLRKALGGIPFLEVLPGEGNFLLCEARGIPARDVAGFLRRRGIAVRGFTEPRLERYMRITVGTRRECGLLVGALRGLEAGNAAEKCRDPQEDR